MSKNFKLIIEYDGTGFAGWQRQKDQLSVQGEIENILSLILNQNINISGSGRTDAGVHASGQTASFNAETRLTPFQIQKGFNSLEKHPIVIHKCEIVDERFHARYSAVSKEYHYHILNREIPCAIKRQYYWHIKRSLDIDMMNHCCNRLLGEHDFKSFENTGSPRSSTIRKIFSAQFDTIEKDNLCFKIKGSGFLKYMVRNIVGTLVQVGLGKISKNEFIEIFSACDRTKAGPAAPAHGLVLYKVNYS